MSPRRRGLGAPRKSMVWGRAMRNYETQPRVLVRQKQGMDSLSGLRRKGSIAETVFKEV